jgi:hypothetical protein
MTVTVVGISAMRVGMWVRVSMRVRVLLSNRGYGSIIGGQQRHTQLLLIRHLQMKIWQAEPM